MRWIEKDFLTKSGSNKWIATIIRNILKTLLILLGRYLNHLPNLAQKVSGAVSKILLCD